MSFTVIDQYNSFVENNFIKKDPKQLKVLDRINDLWINKEKRKFFFKNKFKQGIYVYGSVGTGKTFLLNIFYQNTKIGKKIHFNHLMNEIHNKINVNNSQDKKLETYIINLSKKTKVLFIDELHIFNIVDALIVRKLFMFLYKYKIFVLVSSNFHPKNLYEGGLQRADFVPFIDLLMKKFEVINLDNETDYRRLTLNQSKTYFTPINSKTNEEFKKLFSRFVDSSFLCKQIIKTKSREIVLDNCSANVAFCSFDSLCNVNLAHEDYKNISNKFSLIFIENVPEFNDGLADQCRRFISLIDMLYEQNCSIVLLAASPITSLCKIDKLKKEFARTSSRLYEMTIIKQVK